MVGTEQEGVSIDGTFQVAEVRKPLMAIKRIIERGNIVQFGSKPEESFIYNKEAQVRIPLQDKGKGSFVVKGRFASGKETEITVDSGAEENVCPWEWGQEFGINQAVKRIRFRGAGGDLIKHWGERKVIVNSIF